MNCQTHALTLLLLWVHSVGGEHPCLHPLHIGGYIHPHLHLMSLQLSDVVGGPPVRHAGATEGGQRRSIAPPRRGTVVTIDGVRLFEHVVGCLMTREVVPKQYNGYNRSVMYFQVQNKPYTLCTTPLLEFYVSKVGAVANC